MEPGYIAFFDSGIGGLTLLKECAQQLAGESFLYFGDNANAPYGNKSPEEIERLTLTAFGYLSRFPLKAAVLACNTVTAECAAALRARCPFPVLGVEPALKPAAKACKNVLVLATRATLSSKKFRALAESVSAPAALPFTARGIWRARSKTTFSIFRRSIFPAICRKGNSISTAQCSAARTIFF